MTARILGTAMATAALATGSIVAATPASAQENVRGSVTLPSEGAVVECDGDVGIGLTFDVDFVFHWTYDDAGLVRERLTLRSPVRGTGNTVTDYADGTRTTSGNGRSMTMPGVGTVLHEAGHAVFDLETGQLLVSHGPAVNEATPEGAQLVCAAMGLSGGVPLEPPNVHD